MIETQKRLGQPVIVGNDHGVIARTIEVYERKPLVLRLSFGSRRSR